MLTAGDVDIEELYLLGDDADLKCESAVHDQHIYGHDDSPLWYVNVDPSCRCFKPGVQIRCDGFINDCEQEAQYAESLGYVFDGWECPDCGETWNLKRLIPVKGD